jgi:hypothetical protein
MKRTMVGKPFFPAARIVATPLPSFQVYAPRAGEECRARNLTHARPQGAANKQPERRRT